MKAVDYSLIPMAIAIFSMFFGAGNVIFPLVVGVEAQQQLPYAFLGLTLTAIGAPLLGLIVATLFKGNALEFFMRAGKLPAFFFMTITLIMLGPFAVLPRCVTVSHAAFEALIPGLSLASFAIAFSAASLLCCWRHRFVLPALGYILSPLLIASLLLIIYKGVASSLPLEPSDKTPLEAFLSGLTTGYHTLDLIAAIYFSGGIWHMIAQRSHAPTEIIIKKTLLSGLLGCLLLAIIYWGLAYASAGHALELSHTRDAELLAKLACITLPCHLASVAQIAIALACLTTVVSLTMALCDVICYQLLPNTISYRFAVTAMLLLTALMANIGYEAIRAFITPVVFFCYPLIILLTTANLIYKLRQR